MGQTNYGNVLVYKMKPDLNFARIFRWRVLSPESEQAEVIKLRMQKEKFSLLLIVIIFC